MIGLRSAIAERRCVTPSMVMMSLLLGGCDLAGSSFLSPAGPVAAADTHLFIIVAYVLFFVAAPVLLLTPFMAWRFRDGRRTPTIARSRSAVRKGAR